MPNAPITAEELRQILKSPENRRAVKAVQIITEKQPIAELYKLLDKGVPDVYYVRPPRTRSKYRVEHVLDACFNSHMAVIPTGPSSALITPATEAAGREVYFELLLERGFTAGSNNYRGPLLQHILRGCFYQDRAHVHRSFSRIIARLLPEKITHFAMYDYAWTHKIEDLEFMNELGAVNTTPGMLDCALRYLRCDSPEGPEGRLAVVRRLVVSGSKLLEPIRDYEWNRIQPVLAADKPLMSRLIKLRAEVVPKPTAQHA